MLDVTHIFRRSIFVLVSLSAVMLALAEGAVFPNALTVPLAIVAYALTSGDGRFGRRQLTLTPMAANLLGLLALLFFAGEWVGGELTVDAESIWLSRVLAGTHLIIYLSWIVLFQQKSAKHYWWMFALSVLQVAVGAVLTTVELFGLLLFIYLFTAIWTLSLFSLHLARQQMRRPAEAGDRKLEEAGGRGAPSSLLDPPSSILQPSSILWENNARGWRQQRVDLRFVLGAIGTALASIGVACFFFLLVPRFWIGTLPVVQGGSGGGMQLRMTGFSDEVQLGSMGRILESTERVLFVRMYGAGGREIDVPGHAQSLGYDEPLFRGAVLGTYENGRWVAGRMGSEPEVLLSENRGDTYARQEFRMTLTGSKYLFAMHPVNGCEIRGGDQKVGQQPFSAMLLRQQSPWYGSTVDYTVYSPLKSSGEGPPAISRPRQFFRSRVPFRPPGPPGRPGPPGTRTDTYAEQFERLKAQCLAFPNEGGRLSRLEALARQVAGYGTSPGERPQPPEMARRLETYLRDSGEFGYSLDSSVVDAGQDPVEDFLFNRKQGHCEYYAASLALMLRAVDIPSRLVNGFKGGEVNRLTGEFYVEQRHAHAWVEAFLDDRWVTLDATPVDARSQSVAGLAPSVLSWNDLLNMFKEQWSSSFVSMDFAKQQQQFYRPLRNAMTGAWDSLRDDSSPTARRHGSLREFLASPENWFSWQGAAITAALLSTIILVGWGVRQLWRSGRKAGWHGGRNRSAVEVRVEFYERFRALCRALGLVRGEAQTEREFLVAVEGAMRGELAGTPLERAPADLVNSFYDVRFGRRTLDAPLARQIDDQLTALERLASQVERKTVSARAKTDASPVRNEK